MDEPKPIEVILRPFAPADDAEVSSWFEDAGELRFFAGRRLRWPLDSAQWDDIRSDPTVTSLTGVVGDDPTPVVHVELVAHSATLVELARFAVSPKLRAHGVGRATMPLVLVIGREAGYSRIFLEVHRDNTNAILAYRTFGFELAGDSEAADRLRMEIHLDAPADS